MPCTNLHFQFQIVFEKPHSQRARVSIQLGIKSFDKADILIPGQIRLVSENARRIESPTICHRQMLSGRVDGWQRFCRRRWMSVGVLKPESAIIISLWQRAREFNETSAEQIWWGSIKREEKKMTARFAVNKGDQTAAPENYLLSASAFDLPALVWNAARAVDFEPRDSCVCRSARGTASDPRRIGTHLIAFELGKISWPRRKYMLPFWMFSLEWESKKAADQRCAILIREDILLCKFRKLYTVLVVNNE